MTADSRRSSRYADFLPITVTVGSTGDDHALLAGPFAAHIVNISRHGVCLLLPQVLLHTFHLFHSTREDESRVLRLQIKLPHRPDCVLIPARPVWLHSEETADMKIFKMGVDFVVPVSDELLRKMHRMVNRG